MFALCLENVVYMLNYQIFIFDNLYSKCLYEIIDLITLQEMCCGFLLSREMWYRKSMLPGTGAGWAELKID